MFTVTIYNEDVGDYEAVYRAFSMEAADTTMTALSEKFPNASFDIWDDGDNLPKIEDAKWWLSQIA